MAPRVRDARDGDEPFILALNAACTPAVGDMDAADYAEIASSACAIRVAELDGAPAGFMILIGPRTSYPSLNYAWFEERYDRHLYIDRVAVDRSIRGAGVGRALYDDAAGAARRLGLERLTAEVNDDPPNPQSHAFHRALGFSYLLSRPWKDKIVAMYERAV